MESQYSAEALSSRLSDLLLRYESINKFLRHDTDRCDCDKAELEQNRSIRAIEAIWGYDTRSKWDKMLPAINSDYYERHSITINLTVNIVTPPTGTFHEPPYHEMDQARGYQEITIPETVNSIHEIDSSPADTQQPLKLLEFDDEPDIRAVYTIDDRFCARDNFRIIEINGERLPPLTPMQADVVRILYIAHIQKLTPMAYGKIFSYMKNPTSRIGNIFRPGDPRRKILVQDGKKGCGLNI